MLVNQIIPMEMKDRICVHCDRTSEHSDPMTYLIAGKGMGKTTETIRQAVFRRNTILSTEPDFYRSAGMKHANEAKGLEVSFISLHDIVDIDYNLTGKETLELCVDNGREILEELLSLRFGIPVKINFMALEA